MHSQAQVHLLKSEYAEARSIHDQIMQDTSLDRNPLSYAFSLLSVASIESNIGTPNQSVYTNLEQAKIIFSIQFPVGVTYCETILADLALGERNTLLASTLFQKCLNSDWGMENQILSFCLERLADTARWETVATGWSYRWPVIYLAHAKKAKEKLALHKALLLLGDVFISHNAEDTACNLFTVALEGFTCMDVHRSQAQCMLRLGDLSQNQGDMLKATKRWKAAQPLFERSLQINDVSDINTRLAAVKEENQKALTHLTTLHVPATLLANPTGVSNTEIKEVKNKDGNPQVEGEYTTVVT
jgi:hypothetical protein